MFTRDNHITIPGWVITDLQLSGNEAICYSIIFGFVQDRESEFYGSLNYLASAMGMQRQNVKRVLDRLIDKGLIEKREEWQNGVKYCKYNVIKATTALSNREQWCSQNENRCNQNDNGGVLKTRTNNIKDNIDNNTPLISPQGETPQESISKNKKSAKAKPTPQVPLAPLPYHSAKFNEVWEFLCSMPKWKNKTNYALNLSIRKLSQVTEAEAIGMIEEAIEKGWQGIFLPKDKQQSIRKPPKYIDIKDIM